jgi:hypothetical protein
MMSRNHRAPILVLAVQSFAAILYKARKTLGQFPNPVGLPQSDGVGWNQLCADPDCISARDDYVGRRVLVDASGGD